MKDERDVEELVRNLCHPADPRTHDRILNTLLETLKQQRRERLAMTGLTLRMTATRSLAAATLLGLVLLLVFAVRNWQPHATAPVEPATAQTRLDRITELSLEKAFRRGGIEAVERQYREVFGTSIHEAQSPSIQELLAEFLETEGDPGGEDQ